jgi:hypothetical protein
LLVRYGVFREVLMIDQIIVQYVGFNVKLLVREYIFAVREPSNELLEYTVTIANQAFVSHRAQSPDRPNICSLRLHRELAANANRPPTNEFCVTDSELADYQNDSKPKPVRKFRIPRED